MSKKKRKNKNSKKENTVTIQCENICKKFSLCKNLKDKAASLFGKNKDRYVHEALKNVTITINKGEIVGLIGMNGSGKTTLSRIISGITAPSSGKVTVNGEVNMLSASTGLNNYMSGIDNIKYKCMLLGLNKKKTKELIPKIVEFSDLGKYIDQPLRTYSSGMRARLGFSISVFILPDILIVDEALSVGDIGFAQRCSEKIKELKDSGRTIIFVSHSAAQMNDLCDRILWINNGSIIADDKPENLILPYCAFARDFAKMTNEERLNNPNVLEYQKKHLPNMFKESDKK